MGDADILGGLNRRWSLFAQEVEVQMGIPPHRV
jgi:hypothetical protein